MTKPARSFFVLSLLILLAACNEKAVNDQTSGKPIGAPVTTVEVVDIPVSYTVPGSVISDGRIVVSSRVVGFIEQLDVREGQKVSRGDLLVRIDPSDIDEAIRQAQAGVRASQEDLEDA